MVMEIYRDDAFVMSKGLLAGVIITGTALST
jgi:hypothetical protein